MQTSFDIRAEIDRLEQIIWQRDKAFHEALRLEHPNWVIVKRRTAGLANRYGHVFNERTYRQAREAWEAANPLPALA